MSSETLGSRLRDARKRHGWNQGELARRAGIGQSTLSKLENDVQASTSDVVLLAEVLGVTALWLTTGRKEYASARTDPVNSDTVNIPNRIMDDDVTLYQYADPRCPVGINSGNYRNPELPAITVSTVTLEALSVAQEDCIAYIHKDASMGATIAPGDECIIRADQTLVDEWNGRIFAIAGGSSGHVTIRRIVAKASGGYLVSFDTNDKARFPDEELTPSEVRQLNVIGRVCWSSGAK